MKAITRERLLQSPPVRLYTLRLAVVQKITHTQHHPQELALLLCQVLMPVRGIVRRMDLINRLLVSMIPLAECFLSI